MGEGMPWNIVMIFFFLGILLAINMAHNERKKRENDNSPPPQ